MKNKGFTLMELMVVIIIIGILATLALTYYGPYKEGTLDREAKANLRLILAAQRVYRLEESLYYPKAGGLVNNMGNINTDLKLLLSNPANQANRSWDYLTTATVNPPATCVKATRNDGSSNPRTFSLHHDQDEPVPGGTCP